MIDATLAHQELFALRHQLISEFGLDLARFHASTDRQSVRNSVFEIMANLTQEQGRIHTVMLRKESLAPELRRSAHYYRRAVELTLATQIEAALKATAALERLIIFLDRPARRGREFQAMEKALKLSLAEYVADLPYVLMFHSSESHHGLQLADYAAWAASVKWERGERRPFDLIRHLFIGETELNSGSAMT